MNLRTMPVVLEFSIGGGYLQHQKVNPSEMRRIAERQSSDG